MAQVFGWQSSLRRNDYYQELRDPRVDLLIQTNRKRILKDSRQSGCDFRSLERQIRLHLPRILERSDAGPTETYERVRTLAIARASKIAHARKIANIAADNYNISDRMEAVSSGIRTASAEVLPIDVREVAPSIGHIYQSDIHYLRSPRADTVFEFGAFEPDMNHPLLYMAFSICDRAHLQSVAEQILPGQSSSALVLTRVVGTTLLPRNLITYTLSRVIKIIVSRGFGGVMLTAVNPYLGFTGASVLASGFRAVARAPVRYCYSNNGEYVTGRLSETTDFTIVESCPPNVIFARAIDKKSARRIDWGKSNMSNIKTKEYLYTSRSKILSIQELEMLLPKFRGLLEAGWSRRTLHPDFAARFTKGSPVGQCGVTSVWLARQLRSQFGIDAVYCYGDLEFNDRPFGPVKRHCWLEIELDGKLVVLDLTADQAFGFNERVVVDYQVSLRERGVLYNSRIRKPLDLLPMDAVWPRFLVLADSMTVRISEVA